MGTIKIGSASNRKGVTVEPDEILYNGNKVSKIMKGNVEVWKNPEFIYKLGNEYTNITGGWLSSGYTASGGGYSIMTQTKNSNNMYIYGASGKVGLLGIQKAIDLTKYSKLYIYIKDYTISSGYGAYLNIKNEKTWVNGENGLLHLTSFGVMEADISNYNGLYYIFVYAHNNANRTATIEKIWLE